MLKRVSALASLTLTATLSGLVREVAIAFSLGTTATADALAIGIFLIDLVNTLFLTGGVGYAFIPVIKRVRHTTGDPDARQLIMALVARIAVLALLVASITLLFMDPLVSAFAHTMTPTQTEHASAVLRGAIVSVAIMAVASSLGAALYGFENFIAATCARVGWNAAIVLTLLLLSRVRVQDRAAAALIIASVVALCVSVIALRRLGRPTWSWRHPEMKSVMLGAAPGLLAVLMGNLLLGFWERTLLAQLGEGSIAIVNYALRASYMASTLSLAVHTVAFNEIVAALQVGGVAHVRQLVEKVIRQTLLFLGPVAAIMVIARTPIIALLYGRGAFDAMSVDLTSGVFGLYALDIIPVFLLGILLRVLYATERPWMASVPTLVMAAAGGIADWLLLPGLGARAIPVGYGLGLLAGICTALVQIRILMRIRLAAAVARATAISSALALAGGAVVFVGSQWTVAAAFIRDGRLGGDGLPHLIRLGLVILAETAVVGAVVVACARIWQMRELSDLVADLRARRRATQQVAS